MKNSSIILTSCLLLLCQISFAQYYYFSNQDAGVNPGDLNKDFEIQLPSGWTNILGTNNDTTWSSKQTIPFDFKFNEGSVSEYIVAYSGVLSFSTSSTVVPSANNTSLPSSIIPDSSICIWGIDNSGTNDIIYTKTFGSAPNRQHWIMFNSFSAPGASGTNWTYWSIVLEETSNKIYLVDMRTRSTPLSLTLGIQLNDSTAYQVSGSPAISNRAGNVTNSSDNSYYEFIQGVQPNLDLTATEINVSPGFASIADTSILIEGTFQNLGSLTIRSFDFNYTVNGGNAQTESIRTSLGSGGDNTFLHEIAFNPSSSGDAEIAIWASNLNGSVDGNTSNDTLQTTIKLSDTIPNVIDSILPVYRIDLISSPSDGLNVPTDLDFHPELSRKELWVINRRIRSIGGATVTYSNVGEPNQSSDFRVDGNAFHFMALPSGIAFSNNGNFANSASVFNANSLDGNTGQPFTGPALWSSDPAIYAQSAGPDGPFANGSHYDMLHQSPKTMGIAHEIDNAFWVYDGHSGDIVRYDFVDDHGPGNADHSDGRVTRYPVPVSKVNSSQDQEIPCHLVLDKKTNWLYIADQQAGKVYRLDITSGSSRGAGSGNQIFRQTEPLADYIAMSSITYETFIDSGITQPSGIEIVGDRLLVSDYDNGDILVYDISDNTPIFLNRFITGDDGVSGIKVGPDGNVWFVNQKRNELKRIIKAPTSLEENTLKSNLNIFPNPSRGIIKIDLGNNNYNNLRVMVANAIGQVVLDTQLKDNLNKLDISNLDNGFYIITIISESDRHSERIILQK